MDEKTKQEIREMMVDVIQDVVMPAFKIVATKSDIQSLETRVSSVESRLESLETRVGQMDRKLDHVLDRQLEHGKRLDTLEALPTIAHELKQ